jgi:hypothetical protein
VIGFVVVALVVGTCVACNDDDKKDSYAPTQLVSHRYDDGDCDPGWDDCGGQDGDSYGRGYNSGGGGGNGNRGRRGDNQRGDKNCHSFCGNTIIVPTPPGAGGGGQQP